MAKFNPKFFRKNKKGKTTRILKRGLTAKEKSEVRTIAKKTINVVAEKKFMNTLPSYNVVPNVAKAGGSRISVLGFVNTINAVGTGLNQIELNYGIEDQTASPVVGVPMRELKMLRPFTGLTGTDQTDNYAITGRECMPVSASCKWRLSRDIGKLTTGLEAANWNSNLGVPNGLQHNLPILVRMIRVEPKLTQLNQLCDPEQDLFLSPYNNATGCAVSSFDELELMTYPVNKRRYNVIADKTFKIQNGLTVSYQRATWEDVPAGASQGSMLQPFITNTNANCEKVLTTGHILTAKKGKPVFYDIPDNRTPTVETATAGQKKEYILYHMMYMGAETYLDNEAVVDKSPTDLKISAIPIVKFTDV